LRVALYDLRNNSGSLPIFTAIRRAYGLNKGKEQNRIVLF
jgi:hypothetical protein